MVAFCGERTLHHAPRKVGALLISRGKQSVPTGKARALPNRNNETDRAIRVLSRFWPPRNFIGFLEPGEGCPHSGTVRGGSGNWGAEHGHNGLTREAFQCYVRVARYGRTVPVVLV
jgi:hypothetical protein